MSDVVLDATNWRTQEDFYDALLPKIGAPEWHGRNLDALNDTLSGNDINPKHLPLTFIITHCGSLPYELSVYIKRFVSMIQDLASQSIPLAVQLYG